MDISWATQEYIDKNKLSLTPSSSVESPAIAVAQRSIMPTESPTQAPQNILSASVDHDSMPVDKTGIQFASSMASTVGDNPVESKTLSASDGKKAARSSLKVRLQNELRKLGASFHASATSDESNSTMSKNTTQNLPNHRPKPKLTNELKALGVPAEHPESPDKTNEVDSPVQNNIEPSKSNSKSLKPQKYYGGSDKSALTTNATHQITNTISASPKQSFSSVAASHQRQRPKCERQVPNSSEQGFEHSFIGAPKQSRSKYKSPVDSLSDAAVDGEKSTESRRISSMSVSRKNCPPKRKASHMMTPYHLENTAISPSSPLRLDLARSRDLPAAKRRRGLNGKAVRGYLRQKSQSHVGASSLPFLEDDYYPTGSNFRNVRIDPEPRPRSSPSIKKSVSQAPNSSSYKQVSQPNIEKITPLQSSTSISPLQSLLKFGSNSSTSSETSIAQSPKTSPEKDTASQSDTTRKRVRTPLTPFRMPQTSQGSVLTFSEEGAMRGNGEGQYGVRQVTAERSGEFLEKEVLLGVRFLVVDTCTHEHCA